MVGLITDNFILKLLSLAVAVLLWLAVQGDADTTTAIAMRMQYRNIPPQLEISSDLAETAYVEVRGPTARLNALNLTNTAIALDLSAHQRPSERTYSLVAENAKLPPGITFVRAVPSQIRIRLEARTTKQVPVVVRYSELPEGYGIAAQQVEPRQVSIAGPESHVSSIDRVETDSIELDGKAGGEQEFHIPVFTGDPLVHFEQKVVTVQVKVRLEKGR